jgi:hypothetical protein
MVASVWPACEGSLRREAQLGPHGAGSGPGLGHSPGSASAGDADLLPDPASEGDLRSGERELLEDPLALFQEAAYQELGSSLPADPTQGIHMLDDVAERDP